MILPAFFDAHCHLSGVSGPQSPGSIPSSEVRGRILCGVEPEEWPRLAEVVRGWSGSVAAYGVHPWHAGKAAGGWLDELERRLDADPAAWVGEAGLDGLRENRAPRAEQERLLAEQLRLAARLGRRVNLHCVKAWDGLVRRLDEDYLPGAGNGGFVVHSFAGPIQFVRMLAERGAYFSVGRLFSRRDSPRHRERTALLPDDRLLLESDAFLTPGADATADLRHALDWLAGVRKITSGALADALMENSRRLLNHG